MRHSEVTKASAVEPDIRPSEGARIGLDLRASTGRQLALAELARAGPRATAQMAVREPSAPGHTSTTAAALPSESDDGDLPAPLRHGIEALSGLSMRGVEVHYHSAKPAQLNAHAYAQGNQIHLASGQEHHLAHEAWHVVQQAQGRVAPTMQMAGAVPVNDDAELEAEADAMGERALGKGNAALSQVVQHSRRVAEQSAFDGAIANSPRVHAQSLQLNSLFGAPVQRVRGLKINRMVSVTYDGGTYAAKITKIDGDKYEVKYDAGQELPVGIPDVVDQEYVNERGAFIKMPAVTSPNDAAAGQRLGLIAKGKSVNDVDQAIGFLHGLGHGKPLADATVAEHSRLFLQGVGEQHPTLFLTVMLRIYEDPALQGLLPRLSRIARTELHPLGKTTHTLATFAELQLGVLGSLNYTPGLGMAGLKESNIVAEGKAVGSRYVSENNVSKVNHAATGLPQLGLANVCPGFDQRAWEILGRTVIFHPGGEHKDYVAVKLAKKNEDLDELRKEAGMQAILTLVKQRSGKEEYTRKAKELGLDPLQLEQVAIQSTFPEPLGVFMIDLPPKFSEAAHGGVATGIDKQFVTDVNLYPCFVYRTLDYQYFQYINRARDKRTLHDPEGQQNSYLSELGPDEMATGNANAMHDIFALAGQSWMFTQLIDLYHHNSQAEASDKDDLRTEWLRTGDPRVADGGGRFMVLLDLLRKVGRDRGGANESYGMGRIDKATDAVAYPNVRRAGVADVGDARSLSQLMQEVEGLRTWMSRARTLKKPFPPSGNAWITALSPELASMDPKGARDVGFMKPDLELALEIGAALRRFDKAVAGARGRYPLPLKDETGFTHEELRDGFADLDAARAKLKMRLIESAGLVPGNATTDTVDAAYNRHYDPASDPDRATKEEERKQLAAKAEVDLKLTEGSPVHKEQVARHAMFTDVKHLLVPAEQEGGALAPYVMAAYLSEYFVSHLLLTGTYFTKDEKTKASLVQELSLGRDADHHATPTLSHMRAALLQGCIAAVFGFTGLKSDPRDVSATLEGLADFSKLARQVAFFMSGAYIKVLLPKGTMSRQDLNQNRAAYDKEDQTAREHMVKLGVFDASDDVTIDDKDHRMRDAHFNISWREESGTGADLGTYNGQMPVKEFETLAYRIVPYLMLKQHQVRKGK